jgi:heme oxygenase
MGYSTESATTQSKAASLLQQVKKSTADLHSQLESQELLCALMSHSVTRLHFWYYLTLMKKIEEAYEKKVVPLLAGTFPEFEHRKASQLISDDLTHIGDMAPQGFVLKDYTIPGERVRVPFALGFMYVMEGSKLGGKVIYKHIQRTLGYSERGGAKFIADYGNNTFVSWKDFLFKFSAYVVQNDCEEEAIRGAEYAFSSIYDFFESNRLVYED